jgi:hypothetical protein
LVERPDSEFVTYQPLVEETGLFLTFAETECTPDGVLKFANRYGRLGRGVEPVSVDGEHIEPLTRWYGPMGQIANVWKLIEMARNGDEKAIAEWSKNFPWRAGTRSVSPLEHLYLFVASQLSLAMRGLVEPRIVYDESTPRPTPKIVPVSLLGALYLQFGYAVGHNKNFQQCGYCKKFFELAPGLNRADRLSCSDSCRVLAYRLRKDHARRLAASGKTAREIAKELGSTTGIVRKWISNLTQRHSRRPKRSWRPGNPAQGRT